MPIYDNNGTTNTEIKLLYDNNGTTNSPIKNAYDNNATANSHIYSAEYVIYDNAKAVDYTGGWGARETEHTGSGAYMEASASPCLYVYARGYYDYCNAELYSGTINRNGYTQMQIDMEVQQDSGARCPFQLSFAGSGLAWWYGSQGRGVRTFNLPANASGQIVIGTGAGGGGFAYWAWVKVYSIKFI